MSNFKIHLICHFHTGWSSAVKNVLQTPPDLIKNIQEHTDLQCSHAIPGYDVMLWYKQSHSNELQILGHLNMHFKNPELLFTDKISLDGNGENNGKITIKNLQPNDSAVYFCAVRKHSDTKTLSLLQKHLSLILNTPVRTVNITFQTPATAASEYV